MTEKDFVHDAPVRRSGGQTRVGTHARILQQEFARVAGRLRFTACADGIIASTMMTWWMWLIVATLIVAAEFVLLAAMCRAGAVADRRELAYVRARRIRPRERRR